MSMTEQEKDHLAVRIKHRGQCPCEKGHTDVPSTFYGVMWGLSISTIFWLVVMLVSFKALK